MKYWATEIMALCPDGGGLKLYGGPVVPGSTIEDAGRYCRRHGLGYCQIIGVYQCGAPILERWQMN